MIPGISHVTRGCPTSMLNPDSHPHQPGISHNKCAIAKEYQLNKELSKGKHQSIHIMVDTNPILHFVGAKLTLTKTSKTGKLCPLGIFMHRKVVHLILSETIFEFNN